MSKYSKDREINSLVKRQVKEGWKFSWGGKHGKLEAPTCGRKIIVPKTPSDHRAYYNFRKTCDRITKEIMHK